MSKVAIATIASLLAGFAVAAWYMSPDEPGGAVSPAPGFNADASVEERLLALEAAVSSEREARQTLEEEIFALYEELDLLEGGAQAGAQGSFTIQDGETVVATEVVEGAVTRRNSRNSPEGRAEALVSHGFSEARAEWIVQRESELRMEAMQAQYDAARAGEEGNRWQYFLNSDQALRAELSETEYERYLSANRRPTSINVMQVYESSPGKAAGLQPGDQITHYDGARIFNTWELMDQTMQGEAGETIVVNIVRDGTPMQIVVPRGPIGINTRGGR